MDKVKVSSEMAKAIEGALDEFGSDPNQVLENHRYDWISECVPLNSLNHLELAEILIKGYEVEQTPEELILDEFKHAIKMINERANTEHFAGKTVGIIRTLDFLNIKIEGVNA
ncbi:hypothetical protein [Lysinibacillus telephonicus]|uniref:hypothetical protein n=1 Tax=Lysinibacillus telephonicus TaxID=1714840 RepID=UPI0037D49DF3